MLTQNRKIARILYLVSLLSIIGVLLYFTFIQTALGFSTQIAPTSDLDQKAVRATFVVTGTVINAESEAPIEGVGVHAFRSQQSTSDAFIKTDSSGQYTLTLTTDNSYTLVFNPPAASNLASKAQGGISSAQTLNVALESGFTISGTVFEDSTFSTPVGHVEIFAFNLNTAEGFGLNPADENGNYDISLAAGTWEITFTPPPGLGFGPAQLDDFVLVKDEAVSVGLSSGFTVSGRVTESGNPVPNVQVFAQKSDLSSGFGFSPTDQNGYYTGTLPIGSYDIRFQPDPDTGFAAVIKENVSGPDDQTIDVQLPSGNHFSGVVSETCTDGQIKLFANTFVYAAPLPDVPTGSLGGWGEFTAADGTFGISLPSSTYTVTLTPPLSSGLNPFTIFGVQITEDVAYNPVFSCLHLPIISN